MKAGYPTIDESAILPHDTAGRTLWIKRARPTGDRIARPWLIRRFVEPSAMFLFVAALEVLASSSDDGPPSLLLVSLNGA